jgi:hypothetical protein
VLERYRPPHLKIASCDATGVRSCDAMRARRTITPRPLRIMRSVRGDDWRTTHRECVVRLAMSVILD